MKLLFWLSSSLILFTYVGYPIYIYCRAKLWSRPILRADIFPKVTIVVAVRNEEKNLPGKLINLAELDYPAEMVDVVVVSDDSTDQTNQIIAAWQDSRHRAVILPTHQGKASALNHGAAEARGEIICFTDARQTIASDALKSLVANFADPSVGCVSGELLLRGVRVADSSEGVGLYWRLEKKVRNWEGIAGSTVGATGAFYAVRTDLLVPLPIGTILDDVYIPFQVARQGKRVIFDVKAIAWDDLTPTPQQEFRRKVRTLTGNYQLLQLAPWLLTRSNPLRAQFVCHKLLRLLVPFALVGVFVSTLWVRHDIYELILGLQVLLDGLAILTMLLGSTGFLSRISNISLTFLLLNTAAALAFVYFITGKKEVWVR